jgi:hypothetical protein
VQLERWLPPWPDDGSSDEDSSAAQESASTSSDYHVLFMAPLHDQSDK